MALNYNDQINELIKQINKLSKEDKHYEVNSIKLSKHRNKLINSIYKMDIKKNKANEVIYLLNLEINKIKENNNILKDPDVLNLKISELEDKKISLISALDQAKNEQKNYDSILSDLVILNQELKKTKKQRTKIFSKSIEQNEAKIDKLKQQIDSYKTNLKEIKKIITSQLKTLEKIDKVFETKKVEQEDLSFSIKNLDIFYGDKHAVYDLNIDFPKNKVISIIGPSGCGKSTVLRTLNRINDEIPGFRIEGNILYDGKYDIYKLHSVENKYDRLDINELRTKVGMIFQQPNPFPMSIYKNVTYGPRINGIKNKAILDDLVESSLKDAALWDDVKNNLSAIGTSLSGGQQQRLCIARAIANKPKVLLMDEPTSALDPIAASKIEELILKLKSEYTIIIVTHSMQQAARISDYTAFMYNGRLIEYDKTSKIFSNPVEKETDDYIRGKFG